MKLKVGIALLAVGLLAVACSTPEYGGGYAVGEEYPYYDVPVYGPYPYAYGDPYGYGYYPAPYDRDHYWDRGRQFEQHRWHGDSGWGHADGSHFQGGHAPAPAGRAPDGGGRAPGQGRP